MVSPGLEPRTCGSGPRALGPGQWRAVKKRPGQRRVPGRGSFSIKAATAIDGGPSAIQLRHLILLVQEVQRIVAREAADGELVRHLGPVLTVRGHAFVQLRRLRKQVLQQPGGARAQG